MIRGLSLILQWLVAVSVLAQAESNGTNPLGLQDFPGARVVVEERQDNADYTLAFGKYKKIDGNWVVDERQRLQGKLVRKTLELSSDYTAREGFNFYRQQLQKYRMRELFSCSGRECGSSINWANNHFGVIQLYGLDQYQYYGVYEVLTDEQNPYYVTLYSVLRGNRRVYLQLDILQGVDQVSHQIASTPETLARLLDNQGYYVFPGFQLAGSGSELEVSLQEVHVETLASLLKRQERWRLALVGHDYAGDNLESQLQTSLMWAEHLKKALIGAGIDAGRLETHGLGSLAPAGRGERSARIEVVLLP